MAKLLIVDDESDMRESLAVVFWGAGYAVTAVPNGREALPAVLSERPDAILLDLLMPDMDGPSFLEVIRSYLRLQALPVVILTALSDSPLVDRARAGKVDAVLVNAVRRPQTFGRQSKRPSSAIRSRARARSSWAKNNLGRGVPMPAHSARSSV